MIDLSEATLNSKASQDSWEMFKMLSAVNKIKPMVIVEIGIHNGWSLVTYNEAFPDAQIYGVDNGDWPDQVLPNNATLIKEDSQSEATVNRFKSLSGNSKIDFLFIDGDHSYEGVRMDYLLWSPLVRPGGVIGFHDINNRDIEGVQVDQLIEQFENEFLDIEKFQATALSPGVALLWL